MTDWKTKNDIGMCLRLDKETLDRKVGRNGYDGTTPQLMTMTNIKKVHKQQNDNKERTINTIRQCVRKCMWNIKCVKTF